MYIWIYRHVSVCMYICVCMHVCVHARVDPDFLFSLLHVLYFIQVYACKHALLMAVMSSSCVVAFLHLFRSQSPSRVLICLMRVGMCWWSLLKMLQSLPRSVCVCVCVRVCTCVCVCVHLCVQTCQSHVWEAVKVLLITHLHLLCPIAVSCCKRRDQRRNTTTGSASSLPQYRWHSEGVYMNVCIYTFCVSIVSVHAYVWGGGGGGFAL